MIEWYSNPKVGIYFDKIPHVGIRYYIPSMTKEEKKSIEKYPFINKTELMVWLVDYSKDKVYNFTIPKHYCYDGASIPRLFWQEIGAKTDPRFLIPSMIHDVLCENHHYVNNDRHFSSCVFDALLKVSKVNKCKRYLMKNSVDMFQRFCKW